MCIIVGGNHDLALSGKNRAIMNDRALRLLIVHGSHQKIMVSHFLLSPYVIKFTKIFLFSVCNISLCSLSEQN